MKNRLLAITLALLPLTSQAAGNIQNVTPIQIYGSNFINFGVQNPPSDTCSYYNRQFRFDSTTAKGKTILSILLAAKLGNKKVNVWYQSSSAAGTLQGAGCDRSTMSVVLNIGIAD
ncbi:MAG: hypothetical protein GY942_21455 [Aestuariibacter sp.]|nr:hypothetical protein [Aestuariibacter sp.]